jgi:hypothetical protein
MRIHLLLRLFGFAALGAILFCAPAFATLGQDVLSVQSDSARLKSAVMVRPGMSYSIHEMQTAEGTTVREFVSPAGIVFGVAWHGTFTPDLRQLLGQYFDPYVQAVQGRSRISHHAVHIEAGDLVVESAGHMRFIVGRAYLRDKLPAGVGVNALQ